MLLHCIQECEEGREGEGEGEKRKTSYNLQADWSLTAFRFFTLTNENLKSDSS